MRWVPAQAARQDALRLRSLPAAMQPRGPEQAQARPRGPEREPRQRPGHHEEECWN